MYFDIPKCVNKKDCGQITEVEKDDGKVKKRVKCYGDDKSAIKLAASFTFATIIMYAAI